MKRRFDYRDKQKELNKFFKKEKKVFGPWKKKCWICIHFPKGYKKCEFEEECKKYGYVRFKRKVTK